MRTIAALAALFLIGCTSTGQPRVGAIVGGVIAGALLVSAGDDEDESGGKSCTTVIGPGPGIGSQTTTCR